MLVNPTSHRINTITYDSDSDTDKSVIMEKKDSVDKDIVYHRDESAILLSQLSTPSWFPLESFKCSECWICTANWFINLCQLARDKKVSLSFRFVYCSLWKPAHTDTCRPFIPFTVHHHTFVLDTGKSHVFINGSMIVSYVLLENLHPPQLHKHNVLVFGYYFSVPPLWQCTHSNFTNEACSSLWHSCFRENGTMMWQGEHFNLLPGWIIDSNSVITFKQLDAMQWNFQNFKKTSPASFPWWC